MSARYRRQQHWSRRALPRLTLLIVLAAVVIGVAVWRQTSRPIQGPSVAAPTTPLALKATTGSKQTTTAGEFFGLRLRVSVSAEDGGAVPPGTRVVFTAPAGGASASFDGKLTASAPVDASGTATSPNLRANDIEGPYRVAASAQDASVASFSLMNQAPTIVAAGDIACPPGRKPTATTCQQAATAKLAQKLKPTAVLPLGDNQYENGTASEFASYDASWGRLKSISYPVPGNHEYGYGETVVTPTGGVGYFSYFGLRSHPLEPDCTRLCTSWYSYDIGAWHLVALDSQCSVVGGCAPGSAQYQWLLNDLNTHPATCTLAYWHIPLHSSSPDHEPGMKSITELLDRKGVDVVLNGHAHFYERFSTLDSDGDSDAPADGDSDDLLGVRQFIVGTGGRSFFPISATPAEGSVVRKADTFGVLQMTLSHDSYSWRFVVAPSGATGDAGSGACH